MLFRSLTDKGRQCVNMLEQKFDRVEAVALAGFSDEEIRHLQDRKSVV